MVYFKELQLLKKARSQTFTNWPHVNPSDESMALNGWFYCQMGDRTLCIYCNTICQYWSANDNPYEVHQRLAPHCPLVQAKKSSDSSKNSTKEAVNEKLQVHHSRMSSVIERTQSFDKPTWTRTSPTIESFAEAGFFYSGRDNVVICFYCNGALHQWGENDNPKIEHARWFPHCTYARHLCGDRLHTTIQMVNHKHKLRKETQSIDSKLLNNWVQARLDLPIVEKLKKDYKLEVIKRCLEEQFKRNNDDFASDYDFSIACLILKKQMDIIDGKAENIISLSQNLTGQNPTEVSDNNTEDCFICIDQKRQLACLPCGHLCACVPCGYALKTCPICREKIQSFLRVYC